MKRAVIYARYSTDMQSERSIEDQIALCRAYAERQGIAVIAMFEDRAVSGASINGRPGLQALLAQARSRSFDVVLAESMSRVGRDQEDRAAVRKQLTFYDVVMMTPTDGVVTALTDGIRAVIDSQYLEDLKVSVRRGMAGVVRDGRHAGGRAFGYRPIPGQPGELAISPEEAEVVRRIFAEFVAGRLPREIAGGLNRDGVLPPRGSKWNASTINGNPERGCGILLNELYAGQIVWNKTRFLKDPETGRRISRANPPDQWQRTEAPHLRIVGQELWEGAQALKAERSKHMPHLVRRQTHLLSGLLRCGHCGGGMSVHDRDKAGRARIRCSTVRESGTCTNRRILSLPKVEQAVVDGMREHLRDPRLIEVYVRTYNAERQRLAADASRGRAALEAAHAVAKREHARLLNSYVKGFLSEADAEATIPKALAERERLAAELAVADEVPKVVALHPGAILAYLAQVDRLAETIASFGQEDGEELRKAFRALVDHVVIHPKPAFEGFEVEVKGRLSQLVGGDAFPTGSREWGIFGSGGGT